MIEGYTIEPKPTTYCGVRFRSQLEACWAHLFNQIGMPWEYEPVRLKGWIPDFRLWGRFLVEVKPVEPDGYHMAYDHFDFFAKAITGRKVILLGNGPGRAFGAISVCDVGHGATTFVYDPSRKFLMRLIQEGPDDPCYDRLQPHWRAAQIEIVSIGEPAVRRALTEEPQSWRFGGTSKRRAMQQDWRRK